MNIALAIKKLPVYLTSISGGSTEGTRKGGGLRNGRLNEIEPARNIVEGT
jgi:hypothetical protein